MKNLHLLFVCLILAFPLTAGETIPLKDITNPGYSFHVDGNELFLVNGHSIFVYDLDPVKLKFQIGQKGDGPSDFKYRPLLYVYPDSIVALDYTKTLWFSRKGELLKIKDYGDFADFNLGQEMRLLPVKNHYIRIVADHDLCTQSVYLLNDKFEQIALLHEGLFDWWPPSLRDPAKTENFKLISHSMDAEVSGDRVFIFDSHRGFFLKAFDNTGQLLNTVSHNSERCKRITDEYKTKAINFLLDSNRSDYYKKIPNEAFVFYTFYPPIESLRTAENFLFATTYIEKDQGHEIVVMDLTGQIVKRIYPLLPSFKYTKSLLAKDLYSFDQGKLYQLVQNKTTKHWELHISSIDY
ncbi:MAG: hypothetical protein JSV17_13150 [Candidatus Aminicenantes bacterium]|nr:MAG: hypothetical protein JSV17_13150 [Candidatus Aminicenantes bacterium]